MRTDLHTFGKRNKANGRARRSVGWFAVTFALSQVAFFVAIEWATPRLRDPEFYLKLARLHMRHGERPRAPLVLALGSSRVYTGLRVQALADSVAAPAEPLLFNGGILGAGPLLQLLALDRMLRNGERPDAVLIEFWPPLLADGAWCDEEKRIAANRLNLRDLEVVTRHAAEPDRLRSAWREARRVPAYGQRFVLRGLTVAPWDPFNRRLSSVWEGMDDWGWRSEKERSDDPAVRASIMRLVKNHYGGGMERGRFGPLAVRTLEDLLAVCRRHAIPTAVIWMPEASEFRRWYAPETEAVAAALLANWEVAHGVTIVNARTWLPDENFSDGFHLTPDGAVALTKRFVRDVLPHWRDWRPPVYDP
jgi:hypothetical protein